MWLCVEISRYESVESLGVAWRGVVLVVQWVQSEGNQWVRSSWSHYLWSGGYHWVWSSGCVLKGNSGCVLEMTESGTQGCDPVGILLCSRDDC